jgi:hypothetical protein
MPAAKEGISSSTEGRSVVLSLAAVAPVAENSRLGFSTKKSGSHSGRSEVNFKTAAGMGASLRREGIRSRCQSLNRYAYVGNNPTTLIDPSGLQGNGTVQTCGHGFVVPQGQNPATYCYNHMGIGSGSGPGAFFTNTADPFDLLWSAGFSGGGNGDTGYFSQGFDPN